MALSGLVRVLVLSRNMRLWPCTCASCRRAEELQCNTDLIMASAVVSRLRNGRSALRSMYGTLQRIVNLPQSALLSRDCVCMCAFAADPLRPRGSRVQDNARQRCHLPCLNHLADVAAHARLNCESRPLVLEDCKGCKGRKLLQGPLHKKKSLKGFAALELGAGQGQWDY